MYLFFDTETTGLPKDWKAPISDLDNWPRLVQIAWSHYDSSGNKILGNNYIIKPQGFVIPPYSSIVHRISTERALKEGVDLKMVLEKFARDIKNVKFLVAHNMEFDAKIVGAEFLRINTPNNISEISKICTMKKATNFCQISGRYGFKWPTLSELYSKLFEEDFENAHDASVDISACAKCFFQLRKMKIISSKEIDQKEEEYFQDRNLKLI